MRVLFVDIDTLRADHMGCYGYYRNTTPNFDRVAEEGVRFDSYYCSDAPCLPSRAALISGMFGIHNGAIGHGGTAADKRYIGARKCCPSRWTGWSGTRTGRTGTSTSTSGIRTPPTARLLSWGTPLPIPRCPTG